MPHAQADRLAEQVEESQPLVEEAKAEEAERLSELHTAQESLRTAERAIEESSILLGGHSSRGEPS